ncbi:hypothetical protein AB1Y20_018304 [Prymnesium parvum]|uniref:Uncharacterized protein n=1 Tax=Prymnesium parvum TaxID=97485 RepID=A0AB34JRJ3_PRYPA
MACVPLAAGALAAAAALVLLSRRRRPRLPTSVILQDVGEVAVTSESSGSNRVVTLDWEQVFGKLQAKIPFSSGVIARNGTVYISGTIGLEPPAGRPPAIVKGGPRSETVRIWQILEAMLHACGAGLEHVCMVHVFLVGFTPESFAEMNAGYLEFWGERPLPCRITVGCSALALGATVEIDVVASL